jgi:hypothetical protein
MKSDKKVVVMVFVMLLLFVGVSSAMEPVAPGAGGGVQEAGKVVGAFFKRAFELAFDGYGGGIDLLWWVRR